MQGSIERVRAVINGELPDRAPLYELLRNDAVINHFAGWTLTVENAREVVYAAYEPAVDATRPLVRLPKHEETVTLEDGREQRFFRWTIWTERTRYGSSEAYAAAKREELDAFDPVWTAERQEALEGYLAFIEEERAALGEVFYFPGGSGVGVMGTVRAVTWIEHLPPDHGIEVVFGGDDIAFKSGPLLHPRWFAEHYFGRLARIIDAYHAKGIKVLFHSDGNLNLVMDGLVEAGIDGLNPIEVLAGMDVADLHRRSNILIGEHIEFKGPVPFTHRRCAGMGPFTV